MDIIIEEPRGDKKNTCMRRIQQVIVQGTIKNPEDYKVTSGNKWLGKFENLKVVHENFKQPQITFVVCWKNGRINRWEHDFELATDWHLDHVSLTYTDRNGNIIMKVTPEDFRFHYNIARDGTIKNWKEHKKSFISILRWSLDNLFNE